MGNFFLPSFLILFTSQSLQTCHTVLYAPCPPHIVLYALGVTCRRSPRSRVPPDSCALPAAVPPVVLLLLLFSSYSYSDSPSSAASLSHLSVGLTFPILSEADIISMYFLTVLSSIGANKSLSANSLYPRFYRSLICNNSLTSSLDLAAKVIAECAIQARISSRSVVVNNSSPPLCPTLLPFK